MTTTDIARQETLDVTPLRFYAVRQNNSFGVFDYDREAGVSIEVIVQATSPGHAESLLEGILCEGKTGYFGSGDCPCCGSRWSLWISESDGADQPTSEYGSTPIDFDAPASPIFLADEDTEFYGFVHYLDGRVVPYGPAA